MNLGPSDYVSIEVNIELHPREEDCVHHSVQSPDKKLIRFGEVSEEIDSLAQMCIADGSEIKKITVEIMPPANAYPKSIASRMTGIDE